MLAPSRLVHAQSQWTNPRFDLPLALESTRLPQSLKALLGLALNLHPSLVISIRFSYSLVHCALQLAAPSLVREKASALASYN